MIRNLTPLLIIVLLAVSVAALGQEAHQIHPIGPNGEAHYPKDTVDFERQLPRFDWYALSIFPEDNDVNLIIGPGTAAVDNDTINLPAGVPWSEIVWMREFHVDLTFPDSAEVRVTWIRQPGPGS